MSLIPICPPKLQCTFSKVATKREAKKRPVTMRSRTRGRTTVRPAVSAVAVMRRF